MSAVEKGTFTYYTVKRVTFCKRTQWKWYQFLIFRAHVLGIITKTRLYKYIENFTPKTENFQIKNSVIFHISAQNIDCGYPLEPPRSTHNLCFLQIKKNSDIFHISAQNIDCGYPLEPPRSTHNLCFLQIKKNWYFSYFCSKHRLWVPVRTASKRRF